MTPADTLAVLDLSLALAYDDEPKVFCPAFRRDKWGHVAVTCRLHLGHPYPNDHVDVHAGRRFTDKETVR